MAHVEDLESISNVEMRARCEKKCILLARELLLHRKTYQQIQDIIVLAKKYRDQ